MIFLVKLAGILIMALGITIFASPQITQKIFEFCKEGNRLYYSGVIRTVVGIIILILASNSLVPLAAIALGLMLLLSGIVIFAADQDKLKTLLNAFNEMPGLTMRLFGLIAASFGILIYAIFQ